MSNRLYFEGLDLSEWENLAGEMFDRAEEIVRDYVLGAEQAIRAAYPSTAGSIPTGMTNYFRPNREALVIIAGVKNTHGWAWLYEHGSKARHTDKGWSRGAERPRHVFLPLAYEWNRREQDELRSMLEQTFGFIVSGQNDEADLIG